MNDIEPGIPYLEHLPKHGGPVRRAAIRPLPFTLGRADSTQLRIESTQVSREHAAILRAEGELWIKDLGSTNGTFVNGQRISEARLAHGDIVHVATTEFTYFDGQTSKAQPVATQVVDPREARAAQLGAPTSVLGAVRRLQEMLLHHCLRITLAPVVAIESEVVLGYAAVGGEHELGRSPADHYLLADETRLTDRLNQMARLLAVEQAAPLGETRLFLPLHASELGHAALVDSLCALAGAASAEQTLVLEVPEHAVAAATFGQPVRECLAEHGIALAYADFRSGKGRLAELADVPPEFIKLDRSLVAGLASTPQRQNQVREIVQACHDQGVRVIATGVDHEDDAEQCRELGCHAGQGDWFGPPSSVAALAAKQRLASAGALCGSSA